jgi:AraC-like DNA-binding protein
LQEVLAHAAADPQLTLAEFWSVTEALRLICSEQRQWRHLQLHHILERLEATSHADWRQIDKTVQQLVSKMIAAGKACVGLDESSVAEGLGVEGHFLSDLLRSELGLSVAQLRRAIVMRRAIQMLAASDEQISQIAYAVGYEHASAFNHSFGTLFGISPRVYRRLIAACSIDKI